MADLQSMFNRRESRDRIPFLGQSSAPQDYAAQQQVSNERMRQQLGMSGMPDPTEKGPGAFARIFGALDAPATGIRAGIHNLLTPPEDDVNVWDEMGKSLRGEERIMGADILKSQGVENKWAQLVGGFVVDVILDPISYITLGWSAGAKAGGRVALSTLADDVAKGGVNIAQKYGDEVAQMVGKYGDDLVGGISKQGSRELKEAVIRHTAKGLSPVDRGGIKIGLPLSSRGISVAPGAQEGISKTAYGMKDVLRKAPGAETFETAFMHGASSKLTPIYREGNEVWNAALDGLQRGLVSTESYYRVLGNQWERHLKHVVKNADTRRHISLAISKATGDMSQTAEFSAGMAAVKNAWDDAADAARPLLRAIGTDPKEKVSITGKHAKSIEKAIGELGPENQAVQHFLSKRGAIDSAQESFDALRSRVVSEENIMNELARRITDPAEFSKAQDAARQTETWFQGLLQQQRAAGVDVKSLYGRPDRESLGYLMGMTPEALPKKGAKQAAEFLRGEGLDPDLLGQPSFGKRIAGGVTEGIDIQGTKSKQYNTLADRLHGVTRDDWDKFAKSGKMPEARPGIATELDTAILGRRGAELAGKRIARKGYMDDIEGLAAQMKQADPEVADDLLRLARKAQDTLTDDKAVSAMVNAFDWALGKWKKFATAWNIPRFQHRNWGSNQALLWFEGLWDTKSMSESFEIIGKLMKAGGGMDIAPGNMLELARKANFTPKQADLVQKAVEQGVWQQSVDLIQLTGAQARQPMGRWTAAGSTYNQMVEMQSRLAGFRRAMDKGLNPEAAKIAVDKALYDYSNTAYSVFEREWMMRLVPFYRWQKNNAIHLVELMGERPGKLTAVEKLVRGSQAVEPVDRDVMPEWMRGQLPVSLPGWKGQDDEQVLALAGSTFPLAELQLLTKLIAEPSSVPHEAMQNLNPLLKTPIELIVNKNLFYGDEISPYPGATRRAPGYVQRFDQLATKAPLLGDFWNVLKQGLGLQEREDDDGQTHLVMNAMAHKALSDLHPWMNAMSKIVDEDPGNFERLYYMTGTNFQPFDEEAQADRQVFDHNTLLRQAVRKGRDEGTIPDSPPSGSSLQQMFGRR